MNQSVAAAQGGQKSQRVQRHAREDADDGVSSEDALKLANETIARQQKTISTLGAAAKTAGQRAAAATTGRISDRETTIANSLEAAKLAKITSTQALKAARANNDVDAEVEAQTTLTQAINEESRWMNEKTSFEAAKPKIQKEAEELAKGPAIEDGDNDARARQWIDAHPKFNEKGEYREDALDAHVAALARSLAPGSPEYITYIDRKLDTIYGKGHGRMDNDDDRGARQQRQARDDRQVDRGSSSGAAPSRASDSSYSSNGMRLIVNNDGTKQVQGDAPNDWVEGAKMCGMDLAAYCISQLEIEQEAKGGRSQIIQLGDGRIYK